MKKPRSFFLSLYAPRQCRTTTNHGQKPLEAEWTIEVSDAVIEQKFDRTGADKLLEKIAKRLEDKKPVDGFDITECYDLIHHGPLPTYQNVYNTVKKQLMDVGLEVI